MQHKPSGRGERAAIVGRWAMAALVAGVLAGHVSPAWAQAADPYYQSKGSWGQAHDDQWALKRIGFTAAGSGSSAWDIETGARNPVIVAVIDTGLDYFHPDLGRDNIWRNPKEVPNGKDDDGNGYVDDMIGWNFVDRNNKPWDRAGHGTHVAGTIAAATGNGEGIAGINRGVRIMPLKVLNFIGRGRSSSIAEAIFYAVANGAKVINLSLGGHHISKIEQHAVDYAYGKGVVVVVAVGNEGIDAADYGPAALANVISVGASDLEDKRAGFSNWGKVDLVAPGVEILSLRARRTDFVLVAGVKDYEAGANFVGPQAKYYHASGTSFAAPFVSGVASLLFAKNPDLTAEQVIRIITQSARDIEAPGWDRVSGFGLLDARAALDAEPSFFVESHLAQLQVVKQGGKLFVRVSGTATADRFARAWIEIGKGKSPTEWKKVSNDIDKPVQDGILADVAAGNFRGAKEWTVRLVTEHRNGKRREARTSLTLG